MPGALVSAWTLAAAYGCRHQETQDNSVSLAGRGQKDVYNTVRECCSRQREQHMQNPRGGKAENMFVKMCGWSLKCW